jgi:hypothetical protein
MEAIRLLIIKMYNCQSMSLPAEQRHCIYNLYRVGLQVRRYKGPKQMRGEESHPKT